jgi:hypothetical protein
MMILKVREATMTHNQQLPLGIQLNLYRSQILAPLYKPRNLAFRYTTKEGVGMVAGVFPITTLHRLSNKEELETVHICKCKTLCTTKTCKCRRAKTACSHRCKCKGQCKHTLDVIKNNNEGDSKNNSGKQTESTMVTFDVSICQEVGNI